MVPLTIACVDAAADQAGIWSPVLWAIEQVEAGRVGAVHWNDNNTFDMGPLQINSSHLQDSWIRDRLGTRTAEETKTVLINDGCANVMIAALLLKREYQDTGSILTAIGNYHSHSPRYHTQYRDQIRSILVSWMGQAKPRGAGR